MLLNKKKSKEFDPTLDKKTNLEIEWMVKSSSSGYKATLTGHKLPDKIKVMLVNQLLRELGVKIEVRDHE